VSTAVAVVYDAAGNVVSATDPEGRATTYTYTPDGRPLTKTGHSGTVTKYTYDPTSGLQSGVTVTAPGQPTRTVTFTRVLEGQPGAGQVKTVSDGSGTITYGYDVDGHRTSVAYPDGTSTAADYNDKGQLVTATDVTGAVTTFVYDPADGTLKSATQRRGTTVLASVVYTYDAMSRVATTTRGNGTVTTNTYTPQNDLASQTTKDASGKVIEAHAYTYDDHHNPATRTDTYAPGGAATAAGGTWTTVYSYDAYDRLVGSAVYNGPLTNGAPTGLPVTTTGYTVDLGGDVTATTKTTRLAGIRPITTTSTSTNTIDDSGRLTAQKTGSTTATQTFDDEGRVLTALNGVTTTYMTDGSPASTTLPNGTATTYTLWPDGTRRSATTTDPDGGTSTVTYHYGVDGILLNDSTSDTSTPTGTANTASYLLTAGREARTLLAGTATSGKVTGTPGAPIDTGTGVGYYLRDRHTSVTGLVDDSGAVTATYAYSDYGTPARSDGRPVNLGAFDGGRTNPYTYLGAAPRGPSTEAGTGLLAFDDRTYDPRQGRFTSPDPVDAHNRYQAFNTNPIVYLDLSGQLSWTDIGIEIAFAVLAAVTVVVTAGAAAAAVGAIYAGFEAGVAVTAAAVANAGAAVAGVAANLGVAATGAVLSINDTIANTGGKAFLSASQRSNLSLANNVLTAVAGASGILEAATGSALTALTKATEEAEDAAKALAMTPRRPAGVADANQVNAPDQVGAPVEDAPAQQQVNGPPRVDDAPQINQAPQDNNVEIINATHEEVDLPVLEGRVEVPEPLEPVLPAQPNLPPPDEAALQGNPVIQVGVNAGAEGENLNQKFEVNDPPSVPPDQVLNQNDAPVLPPRDPGTYGQVHAFDNANVILLRNRDRAFLL
jgi:RHS repeat-associated protein